MSAVGSYHYCKVSDDAQGTAGKWMRNWPERFCPTRHASSPGIQDIGTRNR
jgi:hypothetical protein